MNEYNVKLLDKLHEARRNNPSCSFYVGYEMAKKLIHDNATQVYTRNGWLFYYDIMMTLSTGVKGIVVV